MFSWKFCRISKNAFLTENFQTTASGLFHSLKCFLPFSELIETTFFIFLNMFYHGFRTWWISWPLHLENFAFQNKQPIEAAVCICSSKYVVENFTNFTGKHLCWSCFLCNFIEKRLQHKCFPVKFVKFLRAPCLQNTSGSCFLNQDNAFLCNSSLKSYRSGQQCVL